jgi:AbiV family abortive infection protein
MTPLVEDERTLIMANAARLLADAKLLVDHTRFASAFALAVLGVEEIGKVILDIWETAEPLPKPKIRKSSHLRVPSGMRLEFGWRVLRVT